MKSMWWERPTCWICDYWWLFLLFIVALALLVILLSMGVIQVPPGFPIWGPTYTPTMTPSPTVTLTPSPTLTFTPTITPSSTPTLPPTNTPTITPTIPPTVTPQVQRLGPTPEGVAPIEITLIWSGGNDLNLHVDPPNTDEVSIDKFNNEYGAWLDLHSTGACLSGIEAERNVEHFYHPNPDYDTFIVDVVYAEQCSDSVEVPYTVVISIDGQVQTIEKVINSVGERQTVTSFEYIFSY